MHIAPRKPAEAGRITLIGAGPGDPELMTLKALRLLASADDVLHDDLVPPEILALAPKTARLIPVGKRGHRPSCRQEDINALMAALAREGRHVVRLKSGDPALFGRAGEEIAAAADAGVPVEIVPGITAGFALAAALGVSLTHRASAHSVRLVTGHGREGALPQDLDWRGLADPATTLLVYMAGRTAGHLAERLIGCGLPPDTPVVVAEAVSRAGQVLRGLTLAALAGEGSVASEHPLMLGIGEVFRDCPALAASHPSCARSQAPIAA
jgi:uroporphyrin-III C-methyltransferase / precorrin-2 dehydrogenase / sirohydrochlorin ferrochelatase